MEPYDLSRLRTGSHFDLSLFAEDRRDRDARPEENLIPKLGLLALNVDRRIKSLLPNLRVDTGVVVAAPAVTPAASAGTSSSPIRIATAAGG